MWILSALGSFAAGAIGWIALEFIARPIRNFFDMRKEVNRLLYLHWNAQFSASSHEAKSNYNEIGARLTAFDESEPLAGPIIRWLGYKPRKAGGALMVIADQWGNALGKSLDEEYPTVNAALKFPD